MPLAAPEVAPDSVPAPAEPDPAPVAEVEEIADTPVEAPETPMGSEEHDAEAESVHITEALRASAELRAARDRERAQQFVLEERLQVLLASEQTAREEHREERARWAAETATLQQARAEVRESHAAARAEAQGERQQREALERQVAQLVAD